MKKLLPLLLCYILMTSQVFAISGGPVFGGGGLNPVGTYSGLIQVNQETNFDSSGNNGVVAPTVNAIGLFSLGIPTTSVARGAALIFVEGVVYTGTISASVDPDSDKLAGILNATFSYTITFIVPGNATTAPTTSTQTVVAQANGQMTAKITATRQGSLSSARINGTANLQIANGGVGGADGLTFIVNRELSCTVVGFRQSTTASTVTTL